MSKTDLTEKSVSVYDIIYFFHDMVWYNDGHRVGVQTFFFFFLHAYVKSHSQLTHGHW